jgi:hypothetical protein
MIQLIGVKAGGWQGDDFSFGRKRLNGFGQGLLDVADEHFATVGGVGGDFDGYIVSLDVAASG